MNPIAGKNIVLGVTGSIAAYKAADLASKIHQAGGIINVVLTPSACQFITPITFQSVTGRKAYVDADLWGGESHVAHIGLGHNADLLVIAPASANTIAKLAHGIADNLLTVTALAAGCPVLLAPAMDGDMYLHPATQANLEILRLRGVEMIGPGEGHLASGLIGRGRMVEPAEILGQIRWMLSQRGPLHGCKVVVTAGGTQEPIDPVRFITNRSSGKQGYALAQSALDLGAKVTLITGPTALAAPHGVCQVDISSAEEMLQAVLAETADADALLMAAAVADFRPVNVSHQKIKKNSGINSISLEPTVDILAAVAGQRVQTGYPRRVVGFAAETQSLLENARAKLNAKKLDLIVANDVSAPDAGFAVDTNRVTLLHPDGRVQPLALASKNEVADAILQIVVEWLQV